MPVVVAEGLVLMLEIEYKIDTERGVLADDSLNQFANCLLDSEIGRFVGRPRSSVASITSSSVNEDSPPSAITN